LQYFDGCKTEQILKKKPKSRLYCGNYARTDGKKFDGMCDVHYGEEIDKKSNIAMVIFILAVIGIVSLFK